MSKELEKAKNAFVSDLLFIAVVGFTAICAAIAIVKACGLNVHH